MTDSEFLALAEATLNTIQVALEQTADDTDLDIDCKRNGNVLEVEFADNGSKIIINSQAPLKEMWLAARSGGYHYKRDEGNAHWVNTRDGSELYAAISQMVTEQGGIPVSIAG